MIIKCRFSRCFLLIILFLFMPRIPVYLGLLLIITGFGGEVLNGTCPDTNLCFRSMIGYKCYYQVCPEYSIGEYSMVCSSLGVWEYDKMVRCQVLPPKNFNYAYNTILVYIDYPVRIVPSIECIDCSFELSQTSSMPPGLNLYSNGQIAGTLSQVNNYSVTIIAYNEAGSVICTLTISSIKYTLNETLLPIPTRPSFIESIFVSFMSFQSILTIILIVVIVVESVILFHIKEEKRNLPVVYV